MKSPFPGMDPFLESPDIWPDFHDALAAQIRSELNRTLPPPYYARLEMRPEIGIVGDEDFKHIVPDVSVNKPRTYVLDKRSGGTAVLEDRRAEVSESIEVRIPSEPIRHHFVEVRDSSRGHALVTLIEIVSPSNKRPGPDREAYERKQQELLQSDASLIEIDLLRSGRRIAGGFQLLEVIHNYQPSPDYVVVVNRAWRRNLGVGQQVFLWGLRQPLPCIAVPLREGETEVLLDLQFVFRDVYASGPYGRGAVDYNAPLAPPVGDEDAQWVSECLGSASAATQKISLEETL